MKKGFTIIEMLVTTAIIALLSALILPNYRGSNSRLALDRSASQLTQDIRRAQGMAMSARTFEGVVPAGWGIYLVESSPLYYLFADRNGNQMYDFASGELKETLELEGGIEIRTLDPGSPLTIIFSPPDPAVYFSPDDSVVSITIEGESSVVIEVNKAGLISY